MNTRHACVPVIPVNTHMQVARGVHHPRMRHFAIGSFAAAVYVVPSHKSAELTAAICRGMSNCQQYKLMI